MSSTPAFYEMSPTGCLLQMAIPGFPGPLMHAPSMLWKWKPEVLAQKTAFTAFPVAGTARSTLPCVMWWFSSPQFALWELLWKLLLYSKSWQHLAFIWGWMHGLYIKAISPPFGNTMWHQFVCKHKSNGSLGSSRWSRICCIKYLKVIRAVKT